jgi:hypothetical protein
VNDHQQIAELTGKIAQLCDGHTFDHVVSSLMLALETALVGCGQTEQEALEDLDDIFELMRESIADAFKGEQFNA